MKTVTFFKVVDDLDIYCNNLLQGKSKEYSRNDDKLHNFKKAGHLEKKEPELALRGMMTKQIVSLYDLLDDLQEGQMADFKLFQEKIVDDINYLKLLYALLLERYMEGGTNDC